VYVEETGIALQLEVANAGTSPFEIQLRGA